MEIGQFTAERKNVDRYGNAYRMQAVLVWPREMNPAKDIQVLAS